MESLLGSVDFADGGAGADPGAVAGGGCGGAFGGAFGAGAGGDAGGAFGAGAGGDAGGACGGAFGTGAGCFAGVVGGCGAGAGAGCATSVGGVTGSGVGVASGAGVGSVGAVGSAVAVPRAGSASAAAVLGPSARVTAACSAQPWSSVAINRTHGNPPRPGLATRLGQCAATAASACRSDTRSPHDFVTASSLPRNPDVLTVFSGWILTPSRARVANHLELALRLRRPEGRSPVLPAVARAAVSTQKCCRSRRNDPLPAGPERTDQEWRARQDSNL